MASTSTANLKIYIDANLNTNGANSITGAFMNTILNNIVDSFYNVNSTTAVTGTGTATRMTRWATSTTAEAGTWTNAANSLVPVTNNSALGSASLGVQIFTAAATTTTAGMTIKSSAGTNPTGTSRKSGMFSWDGTALNFYKTDNAAPMDLLGSHPVITLNKIPKGTGSSVQDGTWEFNGNHIMPTVSNSDIGKDVSNVIRNIYGTRFTIGELSTDIGPLYLAHTNNFNFDDYALYQSAAGGTFLNSKLGQSLNITIDNQTKIGCSSFGTTISSGANILAVGVSAGGGLGSKVEIRGLGTTNATSSLIVTDNVGAAANVLLRVDDSGKTAFKLGATLATAYADMAGGTTTVASLRMRSGTDQTTTDRRNGSWSWNGTALNFYTTDNAAPTNLLAHKDSDGSSHSFIDQDVTATGSPTFNNVTVNGQANSPFHTLSAAAATIAINANDGNNQEVTLGANGPYTLANPTNLVDGATYSFVITQDGTGGRLLGYGTLYHFAGGSAPILSTAAGAVDRVSGVYDGTAIHMSIGKDSQTT